MFITAAHQQRSKDAQCWERYNEGVKELHIECTVVHVPVNFGVFLELSVDVVDLAYETADVALSCWDAGWNGGRSVEVGLDVQGQAVQAIHYPRYDWVVRKYESGRIVGS